ncbi:MAG: rhomboid family intramembrane serine protease [Sphingosinicella sp.]
MAPAWSRARLTLAITLVTLLAWLFIATAGFADWAMVWGGFIPARMTSGGGQGLAPYWLTPLTATMLHANIFHIGFNLLILVFCGRPVESVMGPLRLLILYLVGAFAAAAAHWLADPADMAPMIGASGAISAVLGAYAILFGRNRVKLANPLLALWLNALWLMAAWIGLQLLVGLTFSTGGLRIAIAAHIGGFLAGVLLAYPLRGRRLRLV